MEGHGRESLNNKELDISRTVGWFTSLYPFVLKISGNDIGSQIKGVKEAFRKIPNKGLGYGILRYLTPKEMKRNLHFSLTPQLCFNYLGQVEEGEAGIFEFTNLSTGQLISSGMVRHYDLNVSGIIIKESLSLSITFNQGLHSLRTVKRLLVNFKEELLAVVEHCKHKRVGEKTPGDFTYSDISIEEYEDILGKLS